jgi:hypothetical protein
MPSFDFPYFKRKHIQAKGGSGRLVLELEFFEFNSKMK